MSRKILIILTIIITVMFNCSSVLAMDDVLDEQQDSLEASENDLGQESDLMSMVINALFYLLAFILVLVLTFYGTKLFAKYSKRVGKTNNIEVLDHYNLGNHNKILAIKIYNKTYILAMNNNTTTVIDSIDINEDTTSNEKSLKKMGFDKHLEEMLNTEEASTNNTSLNKKLLNMKMKVMQLKNKHNEEMDIKEEEYE